MGPDAWITLGALAVTLVALAREWSAPGIVVTGAMVALLVAGVTSPHQALSGFSNPAPITVAALYVLARGVEKTGALEPLMGRVLCPREGPRRSLARIMGSSAAASAMLNNTPVVAMLIPQITRWARRCGQPASLYLMPLSFAAVLGGMVTLVGTSTNIVVSGLLADTGAPPLGMFEMTRVGLPVAVAGVLILLLLVPVVLRGGKVDAAEAGAPPPPAGSSWPAAPAPARRGRARRPAAAGWGPPSRSARVRPARSAGAASPRPPDEPRRPPAGWSPRGAFVLATGVGVVLVAALGVVSILEGALLAALLMVVSGTLTSREAFAAVDLNVILLIASAFGVGEAVRVSGLAETVAGGIVGWAAVLGPVAVLAAIVLCTMLLTELVTNNAAAILMFPIAIAAALSIGVEPRAFAWAVALAASASFLSPIGYQTNAMVQAPGGYRFVDYVRLGLPITATVLVLVVLLVSVRWGLG